ncbi:hypothetical protein ALC62_14547 [Cyphomyrmex costatus]|uniref:Uncharacterized protein n=1 Tax=Cyphomyrmex costatus TaxID=456900 RepID=A0A195C299_9HYME|nr:hypothetical protein ALC62_14547 [Cyphomyrmex costatus]
MKITRIEVPSRVKEMLGDSLDSSLRNPSSRNDYSEDRTGIGTNLNGKIEIRSDRNEEAQTSSIERERDQRREIHKRRAASTHSVGSLSLLNSPPRPEVLCGCYVAQV